MKRMGLTGLGVATAAALAWNAPAMADEMVEDKLETMEQRIKHLEERVASQDQMIVEKESEIAGLADGWFNSVEIGGAVKVELISESPAEGDSGTRTNLRTAELGVAAAINDEWGGEIVIENDDGTIALVDAFLTYEPSGGGLSAAIGQQTLPFGVYDTNLITDPLTKKLGETAHTSLVLSGEAAPFGWSLFTYYADEAETVDGFGFGLGTAMEGDDSAFGADVAWISDIGDSGGLSGMFDDDVGGLSASARASMGPVSAIVEFVTTFDSNVSGAEPSAWQAETAYGFDLMGREATLAIAAGGTEDAEAAELAETLMLLGVSVGIAEGIGLGVEWKQEEGYGAAGTDDAVTVQLAAEF